MRKADIARALKCRSTTISHWLKAKNGQIPSWYDEKINALLKTSTRKAPAVEVKQEEFFTTSIFDLSFQKLADGTYRIETKDKAIVNAIMQKFLF
jgi:uncharacterized protein with gpF-like domain